MKHLKIFENFEDQKSKFKINDYVRFKGQNLIYQILGCNSYLMGEDNSPKLYLSDTLKLAGYARSDEFWIDSINLELVPEYEIEAIKYNL
jgi:hypothetical protein